MATEDRTFYSNRGVDWRRLAIAGLYDVSHRSSAQGGSTITQQVIKNTLLKDEAQSKDVGRKIRELLLAEELERRYSKDQILELYLNTINYGHGALGAEAAANYYFGVHAADLNLAQASFLAGLPQWPTRYDPFGIADQQAAARERWKDVLDSMLATGDVKPSDSDAVLAGDLFKQMAGHRRPRPPHRPLRGLRPHLPRAALQRRPDLRGGPVHHHLPGSAGPVPRRRHGQERRQDLRQQGGQHRGAAGNEPARRGDPGHGRQRRLQQCRDPGPGQPHRQRSQRLPAGGILVQGLHLRGGAGGGPGQSGDQARRPEPDHRRPPLLRLGRPN